MLECALEVLNIIEEHNFEAYIVGGYVRDLYIGRNSKDVDISTNATPKDLTNIFSSIAILDEYGAVKLSYKGYIYDITTFRKDVEYGDNRKQLKIEYTDDIKLDRYRRDFTINTLYMDKNCNIIDLIGARKDIANKLIKINGDPKKKLQEDPLRMLRAIRFATILNFKLDYNIMKFIRKYKKLLIDLSYNRKKEELNRIFISYNCNYGIELIKILKIEKCLGISGLNGVKWCSDVLGIWAQINFDDKYPFTNMEKNTINDFRYIIDYGKIDNYIVYKYGMYISSVVGEIFDIHKKDISNIYDNLPIYSKKDINITFDDICKLLNLEPSSQVKNILLDIEEKIVYNNLKNERKELEFYILKTYKGSD